MVAISRPWYNCSYTMAAKPIKSLELHYTMMQFLIIIDISSSLRPFPSPHIALNAGLQVAGENISIKPAKQKNSDIELQACDGNLFAWIMVYINSPSTYPSDRIFACNCSFGSMSSPSRPLQFFFSSKNFFCPAFREEIREILTGNRTAVTHSTFSARHQ